MKIEIETDHIYVKRGSNESYYRASVTIDGSMLYEFSEKREDKAIGKALTEIRKFLNKNTEGF